MPELRKLTKADIARRITKQVEEEIKMIVNASQGSKHVELTAEKFENEWRPHNVERSIGAVNMEIITGGPWSALDVF